MARKRISIHKSVKNTGRIPVSEKRYACNGKWYKSHTAHTPGQPGFRKDKGIEPDNSFDLFELSIESGDPSYRFQSFAWDSSTWTCHRYFDSKDGTWHWSGSTNQGENSLKGSQIPGDIKEIFNLRLQGW